jgi:hypothetical protein
MTTIDPPRERECERCGRRDVWDDESEAWVVATDEDGDPRTGTPHCLHEWDINGSYSPVTNGA